MSDTNEPRVRVVNVAEARQVDLGGSSPLSYPDSESVMAPPDADEHSQWQSHFRTITDQQLDEAIVECERELKLLYAERDSRKGRRREEARQELKAAKQKLRGTRRPPLLSKKPSSQSTADKPDDSGESFLQRLLN